MENAQRLVSPIYIGIDNLYYRNSKHLMENLNKYILYVTVNLCNGKLYFGVHRTNPNTFDGYIGDGIMNQSNARLNVPFHKAVRKYGYENFKRTTIKIFPDTEEGKEQAFKLEKIIVNETLLKSKNVYNVAVGGQGSPIEKLYKTIYMYDLRGNYLRSFKGAREAAEYLNTQDIYTTMKSIRNNCLGTTQSSNGYYFSYKKSFDYEKSKKLTPVAQYTLNGKFLRSWDSISEAERYLKISTIHQACVKFCASGGYQWRYYNGNNSDIKKLVSVKTKNNIIPIKMFDKEGNLIKEYESINSCIKENPELSSSQINRVIQGIIKSHKGYIFKYKDEDIV